MTTILPVMNIETDRLLLTKTVAGDKDCFINLVQNTDVIRYCFDLPTKAEAELQFQSRLADWDLTSVHWLSFSIYEKLSGDFIGITGFRIIKSHLAEVGFLLLPEFHGHGYATEAQRALNIYAHEIGIRHLIANVTVGNSASARVLEKCGFNFSKETINSVYLGNNWQNNLLYEKFYTINTATR